MCLVLRPVKTFFFILFLFNVLAFSASAAEEQPGSATTSSTTTDFSSYIADRRKTQFETSFGYALFPMPYSLPGLGKGFAVVGGAMNIAKTYTDAYGIVFGGEVRGGALGVADIHIIPQKLILDVGTSSVNKASIRNYRQRGMSSGKDDYLLIGLDNAEYYGGRLTATFYDRRFEVYGAWYGGASKLKDIRDNNGNLIVTAQNAPRNSSHTTILGTRLDLTDDYKDPRRGVRVDVSRSASPPRGTGPDFYVMDYNITGYIPMATRNTWAFNFLRSDAVVINKGETDPLVIQSQQGIDCSVLTGLQQQYCNDEVNLTIANNTYGSATSLGGFNRLRSYSQGRFHGAHTLFYGTEFRWNLSDETKPFDIFIMKDIRTSLQVAIFYERGSTADISADVGKIWRSSAGIGARMITASGVVFRADIANGHDGTSTAIFIGYPWEI